MSKLKTDRIEDKDLSEYLNSHSDFSFELSVLKMLRESDVECQHGGHYQDPVTAKSREFDIRAIKTIGKFRVRMAVECKNIRKNFPILVSCIPRHEQDSYHQVALLHEPIKKPYTPDLFLSRATTLTVNGKHSLYKPGEPVGKSTVQVGRRANDNEFIANDSELYEKWGQCLSSADDLVRFTYNDGENDKKIYFSTVIPFVIVPNDRLWTATYDDDGNLTGGPEPANRCSCFIDKDYEMNKLAGAQMILSHVEIVTFDGMRNFVEDHLKSQEDIAKIFPVEALSDAFYRKFES